MRTAAAVVFSLVLAATGASSQRPAGEAPASLHARTPKRLVIRNAMVIYGNAKPAFGPVDVVVDAGIITAVADGLDAVHGIAVSDVTTTTANRVHWILPSHGVLDLA